MRSLGFFLLILGAGSFILPMMNIQFRLVTFMEDKLGDNALYAKIGIAVLGALLIFFSMRKSSSTQDPTPPASPQS